YFFFSLLVSFYFILFFVFFVFVFFFFFSSRRRHTRFSRDWSSDVCSSDLRIGKAEQYVSVYSGMETAPFPSRCRPSHTAPPSRSSRQAIGRAWHRRRRQSCSSAGRPFVPALCRRSEERRVGDVCSDWEVAA